MTNIPVYTVQLQLFLLPDYLKKTLISCCPLLLLFKLKYFLATINCKPKLKLKRSRNTVYSLS